MLPLLSPWSPLVPGRDVLTHGNCQERFSFRPAATSLVWGDVLIRQLSLALRFCYSVEAGEALGGTRCWEERCWEGRDVGRSCSSFGGMQTPGAVAVGAALPGEAAASPHGLSFLWGFPGCGSAAAASSLQELFSRVNSEEERV